MGQALVFGLIGSSALVLGGAIGAYWRTPHQISGVLLAFASGTLISALAFELFPEAVHLGGLWPAGLGLIAGGLTFVVINTALDSWGSLGAQATPTRCRPYPRRPQRTSPGPRHSRPSECRRRQRPSRQAARRLASRSWLR